MVNRVIIKVCCGDINSHIVCRMLDKEVFDHQGLIYGMGHAIYSLSDPRERIFKGFVEKLAEEKGQQQSMHLYNDIEAIAPRLIASKRKIFKGVSPNVDFYSGFVYDMLGIPLELYTPLFAIARISGCISVAQSRSTSYHLL